MYSTHCCSSCTLPLPTLPQMYGLAAQLLAQVQELVRAEMIVLGDFAPVRVDHRRPLRARPHAVFPMVFVRKTSARATAAPAPGVA